jgi:hypothetical protein
MSTRISDALRFGSTALLTLALSAPAMAQSAPPAKADAAKPAAAAAPTSTQGTVNENDPDVALAKKAALAWLALADAGKFEETWMEAASIFQKKQTKDAWAKGLGGARPTQGKIITRTYLNHEIRTVLPDLPPGKYITVRFSSVFEKNKAGAESVTLVKDGTRGFRMMSYFLK